MQPPPGSSPSPRASCRLRKDGMRAGAGRTRTLEHRDFTSPPCRPGEEALRALLALNVGASVPV